MMIFFLNTNKLSRKSFETCNTHRFLDLIENVSDVIKWRRWHLVDILIGVSKEKRRQNEKHTREFCRMSIVLRVNVEKSNQSVRSYGSFSYGQRSSIKCENEKIRERAIFSPLRALSLSFFLFVSPSFSSSLLSVSLHVPIDDEFTIVEIRMQWTQDDILHLNRFSSRRR